MSLVVRITLLLALLAVAGAGLLADARTPAPAVEPVQPVAVQEPTSGALHCPSPAGDDEGLRIDVVAATAEPADVRIEVGRELVDSVAVAADEPAVVELDAGNPPAPVSVRWEGAPVAATVTTVGSRPIAARCAEEIAPVWYLAGFDTRLGNDADLMLANPFSVDAVARVRFATPRGAVDLVTTQDLAVPAGEQVVVDLDEVQPEVAELGVVVEILTGRAVAVGRESFGPPDEDTPAPTGRTAVPAVGQPLLDQVVPYSAVGGEATSELVVMNPADVDAVVGVTVSAPDADADPLGEIEVPAGGTVRVDLAGLSERFTLGTTVTALNDVPVVVARVAVRGSGGTAAVDVATGVEPGMRWVAMGGPESGAARVDLLNAAGQPVQVDLVPVGAEQPAGWRGLEVEANGQLGVPLSDLGPDAASTPLRVVADGVVGVSLRSSASEGGAEGFRTLEGWALADATDAARLRPSVRRDALLAVTPTPTPLPTPSPDGEADPEGAASPAATPTAAAPASSSPPAG